MGDGDAATQARAAQARRERRGGATQRSVTARLPPGTTRGRGAAAAGAPGPRAVILRPAGVRVRPATRTCQVQTAGM